MVSPEEHLNIVDWFLQSDPYPFHHPYNVDEIIQECGCSSNPPQSGEYFRDYNNDLHSDVDNDEIIARSLQDDFLRLEIVENNECSHDQEGYLNASESGTETAYIWNELPMENYSSEWVGNDNDRDEFDDSVQISSCSTPSDTDEYIYSWEPMDQSDLDGEVGRRLNQMISIPHIPRINGEIPSEDKAVTDHERLLNRLELYGFSEHKVQGDGNCQFSAVSDQLYKTPDRHKLVRRQIVNQLKSCRKKYEGYVPMGYSDYLKKMSRSGEWGDHVTLQAAADAYRVKMLVITSFKDTCYIEILPNSQDYKGVIFLSFWAEVHYNSIYFQEDTSPNELQRKKKWWRFGN